MPFLYIYPVNFWYGIYGSENFLVYLKRIVAIHHQILRYNKIRLFYLTEINII